MSKGYIGGAVIVSLTSGVLIGIYIKPLIWTETRETSKNWDLKPSSSKQQGKDAGNTTNNTTNNTNNNTTNKNKNNNTNYNNDNDINYSEDAVNHLNPHPLSTQGALYDPAFLRVVSPLYDMHMGCENMGPLLYSLVRFLKPKRVLEIGAGLTSIFLLQALVDNEKEEEAMRRMRGGEGGCKCEGGEGRRG